MSNSRSSKVLLKTTPEILKEIGDLTLRYPVKFSSADKSPTGTPFLDRIDRADFTDKDQVGRVIASLFSINAYVDKGVNSLHDTSGRFESTYNVILREIEHLYKDVSNSKINRDKQVKKNEAATKVLRVIAKLKVLEKAAAHYEFSENIQTALAISFYKNDASASLTKNLIDKIEKTYPFDNYLMLPDSKSGNSSKYSRLSATDVLPLKDRIIEAEVEKLQQSLEEAQAQSFLSMKSDKAENSDSSQSSFNDYNPAFDIPSNLNSDSDNNVSDSENAPSEIFIANNNNEVPAEVVQEEISDEQRVINFFFDDNSKITEKEKNAKRNNFMGAISRIKALHGKGVLGSEESNEFVSHLTLLFKASPRFASTRVSDLKTKYEQAHISNMKSVQQFMASSEEGKKSNLPLGIADFLQIDEVFRRLFIKLEAVLSSEEMQFSRFIAKGDWDAIKSEIGEDESLKQRFFDYLSKNMSQLYIKQVSYELEGSDAFFNQLEERFEREKLAISTFAPLSAKQEMQLRQKIYNEIKDSLKKDTSLPAQNALRFLGNLEVEVSKLRQLMPVNVSNKQEELLATYAQDPSDKFEQMFAEKLESDIGKQEIERRINMEIKKRESDVKLKIKQILKLDKNNIEKEAKEKVEHRIAPLKRDKQWAPMIAGMQKNRDESIRKANGNAVLIKEAQDKYAIFEEHMNRTVGNSTVRLPKDEAKFLAEEMDKVARSRAIEMQLNEKGFGRTGELTRKEFIIEKYKAEEKIKYHSEISFQVDYDLMKESALRVRGQMYDLAKDHAAHSLISYLKGIVESTEWKLGWKGIGLSGTKITLKDGEEKKVPEHVAAIYKECLKAEKDGDWANHFDAIVVIANKAVAKKPGFFKVRDEKTQQFYKDIVTPNNGPKIK